MRSGLLVALRALLASAWPRFLSAALDSAHEITSIPVAAHVRAHFAHIPGSFLFFYRWPMPKRLTGPCELLDDGLPACTEAVRFRRLNASAPFVQRMPAESRRLLVGGMLCDCHYQDLYTANRPSPVAVQTPQRFPRRQHLVMRQRRSLCRSLNPRSRRSQRLP